MNSPLNDKENPAEHSQDKEQTLIEHLVELRKRLLNSLLIVLGIFVVLFFFANDIYGFLAEPLVELLPEDSNMIATGVISPFFTPFKLCFYLALILGMPVFLLQIWNFMAPGLYQNEKRFAAPLLISSIALFYAGIAFAYYVVLPLLFGFLTAIELPGVSYMPDITDNLNLMIRLFFAFGLAFEIPVATVLAIKMGITTTESLQEKRPYIFLGCFVVGMLLTPPDIISQTLLAVPMYVLFELGIIAGKFVQKKESY